jgi:hypothetical protein
MGADPGVISGRRPSVGMSLGNGKPARRVQAPVSLADRHAGLVHPDNSLIRCDRLPRLGQQTVQSAASLRSHDQKLLVGPDDREFNDFFNEV